MREGEFFTRTEAFSITLFFGLVSIQYLFSSMYSKNIKEYYIYVLTLIVVGLSYVFENPIFVAFYGGVVGLSFGVLSFINYHKTKKKIFSQIYGIYILLFASWIVIWIGQIVTNLFGISRSYISLVSAIFYLIILHKVLDKLKV